MTILITSFSEYITTFQNPWKSKKMP